MASPTTGPASPSTPPGHTGTRSPTETDRRPSSLRWYGRQPMEPAAPEVGRDAWNELEHFGACILCSAAGLRPLPAVPHLSRCAACGHVMLRPRPSQEEIVRSYEM